MCFLPGRVGCTNNFDLPRGTSLIRISLPRLWLPLFHCRACLSGRASATVILQCNRKIRLKLSFWLTVCGFGQKHLRASPFSCVSKSNMKPFDFKFRVMLSSERSRRYCSNRCDSWISPMFRVSGIAASHCWANNRESHWVTGKSLYRYFKNGRRKFGFEQLSERPGLSTTITKSIRYD